MEADFGREADRADVVVQPCDFPPLNIMQLLNEPQRWGTGETGERLSSWRHEP